MTETMTLPVNPQINITMSILENKCDSFSLTPYAQNEGVQLSMDQYEFHFTMNFNFNQNLRQAKVTGIVKLLEKRPDNQRIELAELRSSHLFSIVNFDELIRMTPDGQILIPNPLMEICNGISISGIRGMYSVKTEGTRFNNAVLPLLDPKTLIPDQTPLVANSL